MHQLPHTLDIHGQRGGGSFESYIRSLQFVSHISLTSGLQSIPIISLWPFCAFGVKLELTSEILQNQIPNISWGERERGSLI